MARIVIDNPTLRNLRLNQLPADLDLRQSYWRRVNFSNFNLSAYDMRDMDIIECVGDGCILPDRVRTDWLISRDTSWTGAVIPKDVSSYIHDLVGELIRQNIGRLASKPAWALAAEQVRQNLRGYSSSWQDSLKVVRDADASAGAQDTPLFNDYPRIKARRTSHVQRDLITAGPPGADFKLDSVLIGLPSQSGTRLDLSGVLTTVRGSDRFAAARQVEAHTQGLGVATYCHVDQLDPWPHIQVMSQNLFVVPPAFGWWEARWPA